MEKHLPVPVANSAERYVNGSGKSSLIVRHRPLQERNDAFDLSLSRERLIFGFEIRGHAAVIRMLLLGTSSKGKLTWEQYLFGESSSSAGVQGPRSGNQ